ncbi:4Fe-4S single cluster domain-containing protein [Oceanobacillus sp. FSL W8-0428]|uniref:4Fe-4S cluster-binding domain-containing protein n=1 Tax=Oceanobacillus TaxID=182709 RepID=UPI0012ED7AD9
MHIQLHRFLPSSIAEGPGKRASVWVQGCPIHCKGCGVPWTWNPRLGTPSDVDTIWEKILESKEKNDIEGITFLGGEPFEQAESLAILAERAQNIGLSIMTFSGYYYEELEKLDKPGWKELLAHTDIFLEGPFELDKPDYIRPWIGSTNQIIHFLTDRYINLKEELDKIPDRLEIYIKKDGTVEANGMIPSESWKQMFNGI